MPRSTHNKTSRSLKEQGFQHICSCGRQFYFRSGNQAEATRLTLRMVRLHEKNCEMAQQSIKVRLPHKTSKTTRDNPDSTSAPKITEEDMKHGNFTRPQ